MQGLCLGSGQGDGAILSAQSPGLLPWVGTGLLPWPQGAIRLVPLSGMTSWALGVFESKDHGRSEFSSPGPVLHPPSLAVTWQVLSSQAQVTLLSPPHV